ncbi:hypothetical protein Bhyg_01307 [Pseudolycoriella hygida]|uniref:Uncharacterized protein n=1 Tax=Pseudolycoriella hygida TaxID=35572 RepID=A0A9Q0N962_9DIPT|nr:hypothetical protein Bhyg_01307 [Pseudolycoriella hygida]
MMRVLMTWKMMTLLTNLRFQLVVLKISMPITTKVLNQWLLSPPMVSSSRNKTIPQFWI